MTPEEIKAIADAEQADIEKFASDAKHRSHDELNRQLNGLVEAHKPLREKQVALGMRLVILSQEIRLRMLKKAFPEAKVKEISTLCQLPPSDHVIGDSERWIQAIHQQNRHPKVIQ